jgi:hypothetical protein
MGRRFRHTLRWKPNGSDRGISDTIDKYNELWVPLGNASHAVNRSVGR